MSTVVLSHASATNILRASQSKNTFVECGGVYRDKCRWQIHLWEKNCTRQPSTHSVSWVQDMSVCVKVWASSYCTVITGCKLCSAKSCKICLHLSPPCRFRRLCHRRLQAVGCVVCTDSLKPVSACASSYLCTRMLAYSLITF